MRHAHDENAKRRLTERTEISVAVDFLLSRGFSSEDIPVQLTRYYYVDIDLLNEILLEDQHLSAPISTADAIWKEVA
jgi:hypothetical protein